MTIKKAYENILMELRKHKSPSLHLDGYNYWINKGIQEYINERYALFASTQQLTDDLQALVTSANIDITQTGPTTYSGVINVGYQLPSPTLVFKGKKYGSDFIRFVAPNNYWHMLGSHLTTATKFNYKCYAAGYEENLVSKRLTADIANAIGNNTYLKPSFKRAYHSFGDSSSNSSTKPDLFYYIGSLDKFHISNIYIDYLKEPQVVELTLQQRDLPNDTSAEFEFPEYVCNEIVKRVVKLILEASSDPRLQTQPIINKTIQ